MSTGWNVMPKRGDRLAAVDLGGGVEVRATGVSWIEHHDRPLGRAGWWGISAAESMFGLAHPA